MGNTNYMTLSDLRTAINEMIKKPRGSNNTMIDYMINMVYMNEIMVADDLYILYWMLDFDDQKQSVAPATLSSVTKAADAVFTTAADHGLAVGDIISIHNVSGMTEVNDRIYRISAVPTTTTFKVGINSVDYTAYSSGGDVYHKGVELNTSNKNVQRIISAAWNNEKHMKEITPKEIAADVQFHHYDTKSRPTRYFHGKSYSTTGSEINQLLWYPGADAQYRLRYWFEARVQKLVNDTDVPLLPPEFHNTIISGALTRLSDNSGFQIENAVLWPRLYSNEIEKLKQFNRKFYKENEASLREKAFLI